MMQFIEKRRHRRLQAELPLKYNMFQADTGTPPSFSTFTQDISSGGLSFLWQAAGPPLALNQILDLVVKIPGRRYTLVQIHVVRARAQVVRLDPPAATGEMCVAVRFLGAPQIWRPQQDSASPAQPQEDRRQVSPAASGRVA